MRFIVEFIETSVYRKEVVVDAKDKEEAIEKADYGEYTEILYTEELDAYCTEYKIKEEE